MPTETLPNGVTLYEPEDMDFYRSSMFTGAKDALQSSFPLKYGGHRIELKDLDYEGPDVVSPREQKAAKMGDKYLTKKLRGVLELYDDNTGQLLSTSKRTTLMNVPWLTERGTFIHNGSEYATASQSRLLPGAYTRRKANGNGETQFNSKLGTGPSFRVEFEPGKAEYRLKVGDTSNLHLYSLLNQIGVPDEQLSAIWGDDILARNKESFDIRTLDKVYKQLVKPKDLNPSATTEEKAAAVKNALNRARINREVAQKTLPGMFSDEWRKTAHADLTVKLASLAAGDAEEAAAALSAEIRKCASMGAEDMRLVAQYLNIHHQAGIDVDLPATMLEQAILEFLHGALPLQAAADTATEQAKASLKMAAQAVVAGLFARHPEEFLQLGSDSVKTAMQHELTGVVIEVPNVFATMFDHAAERVKSAADSKIVIAVDLDKTLAEHDDEKPFDPEHIGRPVEAMWTMVDAAIRDGCEVRIFTARAAEKSNIPPIREWLKKWHLPEDLKITNEKTPDITEIWDDRAYGVEPNEGDFLRESPTASRQSIQDRLKKSRRMIRMLHRKQASCLRVSRGFSRRGEFGWLAQTLAEGYSGMVKYASQLSFDEQLQGARDVTQKPKSEAQKEAGNYRKGKVVWNGMTISIENPKGTYREGKGWRTKMPMDYGYFNGVVGFDGDHLDVFIADGAEKTKRVFVVNQINQSGEFDEHKVVIGPSSAEKAKEAYLSAYSKGWKGCGSVISMSLSQFLDWAANGDLKKPAAAPVTVKSAATAPVVDDPVDEVDGFDTWTPIGVKGLVSASEKLLLVNRGVLPPDERDSLEYKRIHTPDRLLAERIRLDTSNMRRKLMFSAAKRKNLDFLTPNIFGDEAEGLLVGNPLSSPLEQINPMQLLSARRRITQMGPGGIGSDDAITPEMQDVHASQIGFISPVEGPESGRAGIDVRLAMGTRLGTDGKIYQRFRNPKTGEVLWKSHTDVSGLTIGLPR